MEKKLRGVFDSTVCQTELRDCCIDWNVDMPPGLPGRFPRYAVKQRKKLKYNEMR